MKDLGPTPPNYFVSDAGRKLLRKNLLGKGYARCYEVQDTITKDNYACKITSKKTSKTNCENAKREACILSRMNHPNICQMIETWEDDDNIFILLELSRHGDLSTVCHAGIRLNEHSARQVISQLAEACSYMQSRGLGVVHRDLKPENVLIFFPQCNTNNDNYCRCFVTANKKACMDGVVCKICDFGLGATVYHSFEDDGASNEWWTDHKEIKAKLSGTPNYISPEVINRKSHGFKVDMWAILDVFYINY